MKNILKTAIIGIVVSISIIVFKDSQSSKILATLSLLIFVWMYYSNRRKKLKK